MSVSATVTPEKPIYPASKWTAEHIASIRRTALPEAPLIHASDAKPLLPDCDLWDLWPLQNPDGSVAAIEGGELWMVLSAPRLNNPNHRHDVARTRLLLRRDARWQDCGLLFPDDLNPGSREWSGSARFDKAHNSVTAFFTSAGRRGEAVHSFEQRLFGSTGILNVSGDLPRIADWSPAAALVKNDGSLYVDVEIDQGMPGNIKGFRDPYWLRDPADGQAYIVFTGSQPNSAHSHNGVVGLARAVSDNDEAAFELLPPIISADGVCNEMERPHFVIRDGLYYLFWSSQSSVFAPGMPQVPTGLYGMVGTSLKGPYAPLNGTGLVIANPAAEPRQAYCWQVLDTLEVFSFVDHWGLRGRDINDEQDLLRSQFGGTIAPVLRIDIRGTTTHLLGRA
jgi:levansucrase